MGKYDYTIRWVFTQPGHEADINETGIGLGLKFIPLNSQADNLEKHQQNAQSRRACQKQGVFDISAREKVVKPISIDSTPAESYGSTAMSPRISPPGLPVL